MRHQPAQTPPRRRSQRRQSRRRLRSHRSHRRGQRVASLLLPHALDAEIGEQGVNRRMGPARLLCQCFVLTWAVARPQHCWSCSARSGGGDGACRDPRHHPAHAVRGPGWQGKVALQGSWPPFRLPARDTSPRAASAVRNRSCRSPSAELACAGYSRIGWAGRYAAAPARTADISACSAIPPGPRACQESEPRAADLVRTSGADDGHASSASAATRAPFEGKQVGSSYPQHRTGCRRRPGVGSAWADCPGRRMPYRRWLAVRGARTGSAERWRPGSGAHRSGPGS